MWGIQLGAYKPGARGWGRSNLEVIETWNVWNVLIVFNKAEKLGWNVYKVLIVFNKTKKIPERAVQVCVSLSGTVL